VADRRAEEEAVQGGPSAAAGGRPVVVAIDGPSGAGKSTVAERVAGALGLPYLDTGAMYRALAYEVLEKGVDPADREAVENLAVSADLRLELSEDGALEVLLDGRRLDRAIRTAAVGEVTSRISAYPGVRLEMVRLQRRSAGPHGAVMEGRDIGTHVFPETPFKFFLDAPVEVRAERRYRQLREAGDTAVTREEIVAAVSSRDHRDSHRETSPLSRDSSYVVVETAGLTVEEVVEEIVRRVRAAADG